MTTKINMSGSHVGAKALCAVTDSTTMEVLPLLATDNGDGTAKLKIDASVTVDSIDIGDVDILEFPAGNLGQRGKVASLSVAPATDITDATYIGDIKFGESLPSGSALVGKVSIDQVTANANEVVVKSITAGDTNIGNVDIVTLPSGNLGAHVKADSLCINPATDIADAVYIGDIKFGEELPAGTQLIGKAGIDQTTDGTTNRVVAKISQTAGENHVEVIDIVPGVGTTSLGKAEDAVHTTGDTGVMALAIRKDTAVATAADGDYVPLLTDAYGALFVTLNSVLSSALDSIDVSKMTKGTVTTAHSAITGTATSAEISCVGFNSVLVHFVSDQTDKTWTIGLTGATGTGLTFVPLLKDDGTAEVFTTDVSGFFKVEGVVDFLKVVATEVDNGATVTVKVQPYNS